MNPDLLHRTSPIFHIRLLDTPFASREGLRRQAGSILALYYTPRTAVKLGHAGAWLSNTPRRYELHNLGRAQHWYHYSLTPLQFSSNLSCKRLTSFYASKTPIPSKAPINLPAPRRGDNSRACLQVHLGVVEPKQVGLNSSHLHPSPPVNFF